MTSFICTSPEDFLAKKAPHSRILGLDLGTKTIGLALSDLGLRVAPPLKTLIRQTFTKDYQSLHELIIQENIGGLLLGLPLNMDGSEGPRCQSTRQFAQNLIAFGLALPLFFWDERLSTVAVENLLIREVDLTRKRRKAVIDKMAAAFILQGFLERLRRIPSS